jgi:myosin-5
MNGDRVWFPDAVEGFVTGRICASSAPTPPTKLRVKRDDTGEVGFYTSTTRTIQEALILKKSVISFNPVSLRIITDDLITLDDLTEPVILHNVRERYLKDIVYVRLNFLFVPTTQTNVGPMLVSVNPFKYIERYGEQRIREYLTKPPDHLEPHLYSVARQAFRYQRQNSGRGWQE